MERPNKHNTVCLFGALKPRILLYKDTDLAVVRPVVPYAQSLDFF